MSEEKSGYLIKTTFTPDDSGIPAVTFKAKSKTPPGLEGLGPIGTNTDASPVLAEQEPADQVKLTAATVTVIYDMDLWNTLRGMMLKKGTVTFASSYTSKTGSFPNSWIQNVKSGSADIDGNPTMDVEFEFGGGDDGIPSVA